MAQQQVNVNGKRFVVDLQNAAGGTVNDNPFELDVQKVAENIFHIIRDHRTYEVELLDDGRIKVNGTIYTTESVDRFDALLRQLGMDKGATDKVAEVKAPMPGLVVKVLVKEGSSVHKGEGVIVLEAMKMENIIKSPTDGIIATIEVQQGRTVDKNQVMMRFV
ncbi:MAG: biotin/lipoyl-binding protein [Flavobacteriales bacterium]|nr:biotin/lipoyl-binding protein [Flavobacteriales bacterium]